ncbi:hypothetical protein Tcan_13210 [Toxocara canis]|uniref:G_PROTEIN_RECEP_F1_2 domain-containing protein n=1 Tax=Toxocara canis TaxID=6265 RepID=A0A0B2UWM5_TOXCA|nr:hypothetical protein Tcan_13210 [Toxocara canis]
MLSVLALFLICSNLIAFFLGTILNVLVIYLCFRVTNIEINRMRWAIALAAIAELAVCTVLIGLQTGFEEINGFPSIILLGFVVYFPNAIAFCFWESFLLLFVFRLISLPISFLHRYSIICGYEINSLPIFL